MIEIVTADRGHIWEVLSNLREDDLQEMVACDVNIDQLPNVIMRYKVFAYCAFDNDYGPVAIWGMTQRRRGIGAAFAFGTDRWSAALIPMLRQIKQFAVPFVRYSGYHRVEAVALARRADVAKFMYLLGAIPEGVLREYGSGREDFISYRWLADEHAGARTALKTQDQHVTH
jgi:hypothetical protein